MTSKTSSFPLDLNLNHTLHVKVVQTFKEIKRQLKSRTLAIQRTSLDKKAQRLTRRNYVEPEQFMPP